MLGELVLTVAMDCQEAEVFLLKQGCIILAEPTRLLLEETQGGEEPTTNPVQRAGKKVMS